MFRDDEYDYRAEARASDANAAVIYPRDVRAKGIIYHRRRLITSGESAIRIELTGSFQVRS